MTSAQLEAFSQIIVPFRARTALKFATTVVKSRRNSAAIVQKRNTSENTVLQKTARNIAHAVMLFWFKVEKVTL